MSGGSPVYFASPKKVLFKLQLSSSRPTNAQHYSRMAFAGCSGSYNVSQLSRASKPAAICAQRSVVSMQCESFSRREALASLIGSGIAVALSGPAIANAAQTQPKKLEFVTSESGLKYADVKIGRGAFPQTGDLVIVKYVGYLHDGVVFDNTDTPGRKPIAFQLGQGKVIAAWDEALFGMKPGGQRKLIVPPSLAYGDRGVCFGNGECLVPPGETLEFDITLLRVAPAPI